MLLRPLDAVLGSHSKVALLRVLLRTASPVSAREAARLAGLAHSGALRALNDLVQLGVVDRSETPGQHLYVANPENELVSRGLVQLFAFERERVARVFRSIRDLLASDLANEHVRSVVVFGSAARGDDAPGSDLDVLVLTRGEAEVERVHRQLADATPELRRRYGLTLSPLVMSVAQLAKQAAAGDKLAEAVVREGRQIAGTPVEQLLECRLAEEAQG
jgi:predicted nucleotidyltransferase